MKFRLTAVFPLIIFTISMQADLLNREYSLGTRYFSGIVNVTTYHGDLNGILMNGHPVVLDYPGIPEQREFFSPAYETEDQINNGQPGYFFEVKK